ncbi:MAG: NAD(P)/FAD-dependent oxidoreductase [Pseudomonadota bacterium]|nr:MAG: NAD(P)/FAD-dependent oxidoreductase [Pseudomonadota bacterium]
MGVSLARKAQPSPTGAIAPVIVVGAGPVGIRTVQALVKREPTTPIVLYGDEPWAPYNRVRLSSLVAGEVKLGGLANEPRLPVDARVIAHYNAAVVDIDRDARSVSDAHGNVQQYSSLVLATGSRPHVPGIPGIDKRGVFTFRNLDDAQRLMARQARSRRTVVLGGGLLGLEAARAMQRQNTEVVVVDHTNRLMSRQLDDTGAELLREHVLAHGIQSVLGVAVDALAGDDTVAGVCLRGGRTIECDTVIVAAGIRPNVELALQAGLAIGKGIRVNDAMQTTDPDIFAVGECAEHRGRVYGLVAPGLEQAEVAAHCILGGDSDYAGSVQASRLKVLGTPVFSMGRVGEEENPLEVTTVTYAHPENGVYRKLAVRRRRLVGAIAVGEWEELGRIQEGVTRQRLVGPWQLKRFRDTGQLWPLEEARSVCDWPASATVCNCTGVTRGQLSDAIAGGAVTVDALMASTGASSVCGGCRPLIGELAQTTEPPAPERGYRTLLATGIIALVFAVLVASALQVPYSGSVEVPWQWDLLWRDSLAKQITGFTTLGLSLALLSLSLRKRWKRFSRGAFPVWRMVHVVLGLAALIALLLHTGMRMGANLNYLLMLSFVGLIGIGTLAAGVISTAHRFDASLGRRLRNLSVWGHILLFWPLPALLGFHIVKAYYF